MLRTFIKFFTKNQLSVGGVEGSYLVSAYLGMKGDRLTHGGRVGIQHLSGRGSYDPGGVSGRYGNVAYAEVVIPVIPITSYGFEDSLPLIVGAGGRISIHGKGNRDTILACINRNGFITVALVVAGFILKHNGNFAALGGGVDNGDFRRPARLHRGRSLHGNNLVGGA